jgi:hypothetical protein
MRFFVLLFLVLSFHQKSYAHEYFFGFAELSYNDEFMNYEGTLMLSTHEIQEYLENLNLIDQELSTYQGNEEMFATIGMVLWKDFKINIGSNELELKLVGIEVLETGMSNFYFNSQSTERSNQLDISFSLLMDLFPLQQNKLNYIDGMRVFTSVFFTNKRKSSILIE